MSSIEFEFNLEKTIEVILYLAARARFSTLLTLNKLIYLADKTSLEEYGRFITGDRYVAMKHGPVPSHTYDIMKAGMDGAQYGFKVDPPYFVRALRDANTDKLSDSDIDVLDRVIDQYGSLPAWHLRDLTHDAAYEQTWNDAGQQGSSPIPVERIIILFDDSDDLLEHLQHLNSD